MSCFKFHVGLLGTCVVDGLLRLDHGLDRRDLRWMLRTGMVLGDEADVERCEVALLAVSRLYRYGIP